jgi:hypothetical protein
MNAWRRDRLIVFVLLLLGAVAPSMAADAWILQGLFDAEVWGTNDGSPTLTRDEGDTGPVGRLRVWTAGDIAPGLQGMVRGSVDGGAASGHEGTDTTLELAFARYTVPGKVRMVIEAGRIVTPIGDFAKRYLSSSNPLVGQPEAYAIHYPDGVKVSGWLGSFDYTLAYVNQPLTGARYNSDAGRAFRPAIGAGYTPFTGFRVGAYATQGPYLGYDSDPFLPAGTTWRDYDEKTAGLDTQFSHGYFELHGEMTRSHYEIPTLGDTGHAWVWYVEPKYTFTPRFFTAVRFERNDYQFVMPLAGTSWFDADVSVCDVELGVGYRIVSGAVFKVSYRREKWNVNEAIRDYYPDGYAVAAQLSWTFDALQAVERPR